MELSNELSYIAAIAFITILIIDFMIIEIVLQLGVFTHGKSIFRIIMIFALEAHAVSFFIMNMYAELAMNALAFGSACYIIWNPLYYYMLIEQNAYWMHQKDKNKLYIGFALFNVFAIVVGLMCVFTGLGISTLTVLFIAHNVDLAAMILLAITEFYLNYKIYKFSKKVLYNVSPEFWKKVKVCLYIFALCIIIDIAIVVYENISNSSFTYLIRPCSFALKVVFECMCFQFIKGIIISIQQ